MTPILAFLLAALLGVLTFISVMAAITSGDGMWVWLAGLAGLGLVGVGETLC